jgi:glycine hydroxymethyltransferase
MGKREMREIASIIRRVLENTKPQTVKGEKSKARYELNPKAKEEAQKRVKDLLSHYPVYPEIDLAFLKKSFF